MDLHELEAFLVVAEELHFGRAARRLHIAQPPLSRTIRHLEQDFGVRLFDRTTRTVRLTSAGSALVGPAREVLDGLAAARRAARAAGRGETGRVRLGFAGPSSHLLVGRLSRLVRERHPGIDLTLRSTTHANDALRLLTDGDLDLAIVRWLREPPGIAYRIVAEEHYVLVVPAGHELASREVVSIADCADERFVTLPAESGSTIREVLIAEAHEAGFRPDIVQVAPDSWTVMALVAAGVGITINLDAALANIPPAGLAAIPLVEGRAPSYAHLAWREDDLNPALRAVVRVSRDALPTPPAGAAVSHTMSTP